jgi:hypothetical protein
VQHDFLNFFLEDEDAGVTGIWILFSAWRHRRLIRRTGRRRILACTATGSGRHVGWLGFRGRNL